MPCMHSDSLCSLHILHTHRHLAVPQKQEIDFCAASPGAEGAGGLCRQGARHLWPPGGGRDGSELRLQGPGIPRCASEDRLCTPGTCLQQCCIVAVLRHRGMHGTAGAQALLHFAFHDRLECSVHQRSLRRLTALQTFCRLSICCLRVRTRLTPWTCWCQSTAAQGAGCFLEHLRGH